MWREGESYYLIIGSADKRKRRNRSSVSLEGPSNMGVSQAPARRGSRNLRRVLGDACIRKVGEQHALIVVRFRAELRIGSGTWKNETFTPHSEYPQRLELFNHLLSPTPHILEDGRVITMGIIPDQRSPKECWHAGWAHHYSLPRLISADPQGRLHQTAFEGISKLCETVTSMANLDLTDGP